MSDPTRPPPAPPSPLGGTRFFLTPLGGSLSHADVDLGDLIERTMDAVMLIDTGDVIRYWNHGAEVMFHYTRAEVLGRRVGFLLPRDLLDQGELDWIQGCIDSEGSLCNFTTRRVRKDGVERWVSLTRSVLHDTTGRVIGSSAVFRDITEERQIQEELAGARGMAIVGEMSVALAHEIKNSLAGISSAIQLFSRNLASGDPQRAVFAEVSNEIRRLDETALDLVRFARTGAPRPRPTGLEEFLGAVARRMDAVEDVRRHLIDIDVSPGLVATVDQELVGHALQSLILNAAQATAEPARIRVRARRAGEALEIEVIDSGSGIPESLRASIFQPFFTTKSRGTGLGLSIARKNVEAHGGEIEVETSLGKGSCFRIRLPAACAE
ncbi:MAG TPA: ATP-binding protein [Planctomycetota bacterium]|jgi:PAS domain S-box-containing protein|nr:ATP-binding protein [Planctomycetota bacterium]